MLQQKAFSLIELMVVIAILAIIGLVGIPGFQGMLQSGRLTASTNALTGLLQAARSEAVTLRAKTKVCGTNDLQSCANSPWSGQIMAFRDLNSNGQCDGCSAGAGELIRTITVDSGVSISGSSGVTFAGTGQLTSAVSLTVTGASSSTKSISINRIGQARSH